MWGADQIIESCLRQEIVILPSAKAETKQLWIISLAQVRTGNLNNFGLLSAANANR